MKKVKYQDSIHFPLLHIFINYICVFIKYGSQNLTSNKIGHCNLYCKVDLSGLGTLRVEKLVDVQNTKRSCKIGMEFDMYLLQYILSNQLFFS